MSIREEERSIIIVGSFNPAIFQPVWISQYSLLPDEEMEGFYNEEITEQTIVGVPEFKIQIGKGQPFQVNNDQAIMAFKSFSLQVTRDRFGVIIFADESKLAIRFVQKIFKILDQTPITAYGINFKSHIEFVDDYATVINNLFEPKERFIKTFGDKIGLGFMFQSEFRGFVVSSTIEASKKASNGLYLASNFHKDLKGGCKSFNENDLRAQFLETEDYYKKTLIGILGKIK